MKLQIKKRKHKSQSGQFVIETLLIMFIVIGAATALMTGLKDRNLLGRLVSSPWERISGMMASGHWEPLSSAKAAGKLPHQRATSREGDD